MSIFVHPRHGAMQEQIIRHQYWSAKSLEWFKELKADREARMATRKAEKEAPKVTSTSAVPEESDVPQWIAIAAPSVAASSQEKPRSLRSQGSTRSRSSARLSSAGALAVESGGGDLTQKMARTTSTPSLRQARN
mmetsp:Transcript_12323/g.23195  ORF Transcript_12323/g.23195 Transcript_12323/m.23195 type:complete len:135 (-) Transcript_12323:54-458(-)